MGNKQHKRIFQASLIASLFCFALISCGKSDPVVASVDDLELHESEALLLMKHLGYDANDKAQYRTFLEQWCDNAMYRAELEARDPEQSKLVELRAFGTSGELARYYLQEAIVKNQLDTVVKPEEIKTYYDAHKEEFILHDYIVKALYLKIPKSVNFEKDDVQKTYLLKNDKDLSRINSYAKLYAENFYFNDSSWTFFNELAKDIPLKNYNIDNIVLNRTKTYFSDDQYTYFLNVIDYKLKDDVPPLEFLSDQIKEIIVLNRLQQLKEKNESSMIREIKKKHEINIHI